MNIKYDDGDIKSIYDYSKLLIGKTFLDVIEENVLDELIKFELIEKYNRPNYKGGLGVLLEEIYFGYKANSNQLPDFHKVGLELKSTPYEIRKNGSLYAGERLSITMVPHDRPIESHFYYSDVWHKIQKILFIYYLRDKSKGSKLNYSIDYSYLFTPPQEDLKIIIDDFNKIVSKVLNGKAHELSESDTLYLGACTKGSTAEKSTHPQYYGEHIPAKARNFCFKQPYMTYILNNYIVPNVKTLDCESIVKNNSILTGDTFEESIYNMINNYVGKTDEELCNIFCREYNNNKAQWVDLSYRMLGIKSNKAEEFIKANVVVKALRIEENGNIIESMSFPAFKYNEIINETWEDSTVRNYFEETRFLFVVFKSNGKNYVLKGSQFWNMPISDLDGEVRKGWKQTVDTIKNGVNWIVSKDSKDKIIVRNNLLKRTENNIIHVRPHAQKSFYIYQDGTTIGNGKKSDTNELPDGRWMTNHCFWINNSYIINQIKDEIKG